MEDEEKKIEIFSGIIHLLDDVCWNARELREAPRLILPSRIRASASLDGEKNERGFISGYSVKREKEEEKQSAERERMRRGRCTRAAHPAEMPLGSNRILYVGKQEAADVRPRVLRTLS